MRFFRRLLLLHTGVSPPPACRLHTTERSRRPPPKAPSHNGSQPLLVKLTPYPPLPGRCVPFFVFFFVVSFLAERWWGEGARSS